MKIVRLFAAGILALSLLCLFGWAVHHASRESGDQSAFGKPLLAFVKLPDRMVEVLTSGSIKNVPDSYVKLPPDFRPVNELRHDLFGITALWNDAEARWDLQLRNFRNDSILHAWSIANEGWVLDKTKFRFANALPLHSLLLEDRSLITKLDKTPNLFRLDAGSKVVWVNHEMVYHHSIQPAIDGNIWACASDVPEKPGAASAGRRLVNLNGQAFSIQEDHLVKVDARTGAILFKKGVGAILVENGLAGTLYGHSLSDPIHLNDISPVTSDGPYWKRGDLFLSVRNRSIVILYRPADNLVVRVIGGPLINQHDVNILSDHEISIFNNRSVFTSRTPDAGDVSQGSLPTDSMDHSEMLIYDLATSTFRTFMADRFKQEGIKCMTQGLCDLLPSGELFVEVQEQGTYYLFDTAGVVMRKVIPAPLDGYVHVPTWTRIYATLPP